MGYGLTVDDVRTVAFRIAQRSGRPHPFISGKAGRDWYDVFFAKISEPHTAKRRSSFIHES